MGLLHKCCRRIAYRRWLQVKTVLYLLQSTNNFIKWPKEIEEIDKHYNQHELTEEDFKRLQEEENCMHHLLENIDSPLQKDLATDVAPFRMYENLHRENIILEQNRDSFCREKIINLELSGMQNKMSAHGYRILNGLLVKDIEKSLELENNAKD